MLSYSYVLGIDIGSVYTSVVAIDLNKRVVQKAYGFHQGQIIPCLRHVLSDFNLSRVSGIAATTSTPSILNTTKQLDNRIALIEACRLFHQDIGSVLVVGGEKFGLIRFDTHGNYLSYKANTSCAAGTGSFLDQQAQRLNLSGIAELSEIAFSNTGTIPKIASRCAVFAKTDLVHAQQEGFSLEQICDGLCYGLAKNIVDTLFGGQIAQDPIIFCGGVSQNRAVVRHIQALTGKTLIAEDTYLYGAIGAGLHLLDELKDHPPESMMVGSVDDIIRSEISEKTYAFEPIELKLSDYPNFDSVEKYSSCRKDGDRSNPVEVDIY